MMGKQTQPNIKTETLLETSNEFYQDLLGYIPERTTLQPIPKNQWNQFAQTRELNIKNQYRSFKSKKR